MSDHFSNDTDTACKNQPYWKGVIILHQIKSIFFQNALFNGTIMIQYIVVR